MAEIKVISCSVEDIREYGNNPRRNDKAIDSVLASIRKFGYINPIIVNQDNVILAGHTRLKALKKHGQKEVEVLQLQHMTEEQEMAFRIADNRTAEFSEWDNDLLTAEMKEITAEDWEEFGFKPEQLRKMQDINMCTYPKCGRTFERIK